MKSLCYVSLGRNYLPESLVVMNRLKKKHWLIGLAMILLLAAGAVSYYQVVHVPAQTAEAQPEMQTAIARRGDLVIYASGTGTLMASEEYELGFKTGGRVTEVSVVPGDRVKAGDVLAQVDDNRAQIAFSQAKRAYEELISDAAIAAALQAVADAEQELLSAKLQLEYLIGPQVMYWEMEIEKAQKVLEQARAAAAASPSDAALQQAVRDAQAYLDFAEGMLVEALQYYEDVYKWETFPILEKTNGDDYVLGPTELEIFSARTGIDQAWADVLRSQYYYKALTGQSIPPEANSDELDALQEAESDLEEAQAELDGTRILAPIDGTVMSVDTSVGNTAGNSAVIVVADLSQAYLQIYLDASDWDKVAVGMTVEASFDALPDTLLTGKVTQLDNELYSSRGSTMLQGTVLLDQTFDTIQLPISSTASVDVISAKATDAVLVPVEALHETSPGKYAVFVMVGDTLKLRVVEVGIQDTLYAEILSGLEAGAEVSTGITQTQ